QVINNLKDSTIVFLIQYTEFFARIQEVAATSFKFFHAYLFAAFRFPSSWLPESAAHRLRPPSGPRWQSPSRCCPPAAR
ncbi:hypothetical protein MJN76_27940, partial [Salmonella enterica subsp. enterica serovar Anatum]|nr:hypothetical protein [Salmonella enterica subsp. enterica serovar Anatum]